MEVISVSKGGSEVWLPLRLTLNAVNDPVWVRDHNVEKSPVVLCEKWVEPEGEPSEMEDYFSKGQDVSGVLHPSGIKGLHDGLVIANECNEGVPKG